MRRHFTPRVLTWQVPVWAAHPVSVANALGIARIWGKGIDGSRGTIEYTPAPYEGYAFPLQLFTGWNPQNQTRSGTPIITPGGLPGTSVPLGHASPLDSAMAQIMAGQS